MKYNAKIDWWIEASLIIAVSLPVIIAINSSTAYAAIAPAAVLLLVFGLRYPQSYENASGELLIAPQDQTAFFADIESRAPQLSRQGPGLVAAFTL